MNAHFTGVVDLFRDPRGACDFLEEGSWSEALKTAFKHALPEVDCPYYAKEYVLFPALAGPFWSRRSWPGTCCR